MAYSKSLIAQLTVCPLLHTKYQYNIAIVLYHITLNPQKCLHDEYMPSLTMNVVWAFQSSARPYIYTMYWCELIICEGGFQQLNQVHWYQQVQLNNRKQRIIVDGNSHLVFMISGKRPLHFQTFSSCPREFKCICVIYWQFFTLYTTSRAVKVRNK